MVNPRALVIGGTGPTGPFVVEGLHERGFDVTILHGGQHEVEFAVPDVRHIHEDPHFQEPLERGIGRETFDLVVAQYGRLRIIAEVFKGRTERLVAVGGATVRTTRARGSSSSRCASTTARFRSTPRLR